MNVLNRYIKKYGKHFLSSENSLNKIKLKKIRFEYLCPLYKDRLLADILTIFLWSSIAMSPRKFMLSQAQKKYRTWTPKTAIVHKYIPPKTFYKILRKIQVRYLRNRAHPLSQPDAIMPQSERLKYTVHDLPFSFRNGTDKELYSYIFEKQLNDITLNFYLVFAKQHILQNMLFLQLFGFVTLESKENIA